MKDGSTAKNAKYANTDILSRGSRISRFQLRHLIRSGHTVEISANYGEFDFA
jgi:hypothetical protein